MQPSHVVNVGGTNLVAPALTNTRTDPLQSYGIVQASRGETEA